MVHLTREQKLEFLAPTDSRGTEIDQFSSTIQRFSESYFNWRSFVRVDPGFSFIRLWMLQAGFRHHCKTGYKIPAQSSHFQPQKEVYFPNNERLFRKPYKVSLAKMVYYKVSIIKTDKPARSIPLMPYGFLW